MRPFLNARDQLYAQGHNPGAQALHTASRRIPHICTVSRGWASGAAVHAWRPDWQESVAISLCDETQYPIIIN
eukprot:3909995-Prymnesium_polylepis.1